MTSRVQTYIVRALGAVIATLRVAGWHMHSHDQTTITCRLLDASRSNMKYQKSVEYYAPSPAFMIC